MSASDADLRVHLKDLLSPPASSEEPRQYIGRRVRVWNADNSESALGHIEALQMKLSASAFSRPFGNRAGDVERTTVEVKLDNGTVCHCPFELIEFVEENFSEPAKEAKMAKKKFQAVEGLTDEELTAQAQAAEALVVSGQVKPAPEPPDSSGFSDGALLGIWDSRFERWYTLVSGEVFSTTDLRLAKAQLLNIHEPGRHSIREM